MRISGIATGLGRLGVCAAAIGAGVAIGSNSLPQKKPQSDKSPPAGLETTGPQVQGAVQPLALENGNASPTTTANSGNAASAQPAAREAGIEVAQWQIGDRPGSTANPSQSSDIVAGRPVYLWMTLEGTRAAIDAMRAERQLKIEVQWVRQTASGAPNLWTELTVGRPGLADTLDQQVRR